MILFFNIHPSYARDIWVFLGKWLHWDMYIQNLSMAGIILRDNEEISAWDSKIEEGFIFVKEAYSYITHVQ